jgi:hypothetical protein
MLKGYIIPTVANNNLYVNYVTFIMNCVTVLW